MIELKIQCPCGQKYKFDVEPAGGQMPFTVQCPVCGADGTGIANERLRELAPPPPPPPAAAPQVRINRPAVAIPAPAATPVATPVRPLGAPAAAAVAAPGKKPSFGLGVLGALVGTLVGAAVYFCVFYFFDLRFKLLAVGVGYLAGLGAEIFSRKEGSKELGIIAATMALAGLVGVQYCVVRLWWNSDEGSQPTTYEQAVAEAKKTLQAMPSGSDQEIRVYLATEMAEEDKPTQEEINAVTKEDIQEFRDSQLPEIRDLAEGKVSREKWEKANEIDPKSAEEEKAAEEGTFKAVFLLFLLSKFNLFSMAAAAGLAYKACANA